MQYELDVPDFSKSALSMSGIVVMSSAARAPLVGDLRGWEQRAPSPPVTTREFSSEDELIAAAEIYTNGARPGQRLDMRTTVENENGTVFSVTRKRGRSQRRTRDRRPTATSRRSACR